MKDYEEVAAEVFRRSEQISADNSRRKKDIIKRSSVTACLCAAVLVCFLAIRGGTDESGITVREEVSSDITYETSGADTEVQDVPHETSAADTEARTETAPAVSESETVSVTEPPEELVMTPIPSDKSYDALMCTFSDIPVSASEEEFPDKEVLAFAKEICYGEKPVQDAIKNHNTFNDAYIKKVWSAEDIEFISGWNYDFDLDGEDEFVIYLSYTPYGPMSGGMLIYIDGSNYKILMPGIDSVGAEASVIDAGEYRFLVTYSTGGSHAWKDIYSFETGMPEKAFDISDGHDFEYKDGVFRCMVKYDDMRYPMALGTDGVFREFAREKISREDFEAHMSGGREYLDSLAAKGDEVTEIYTYGYYSYYLFGNYNDDSSYYKYFMYVVYVYENSRGYSEFYHASAEPLEKYMTYFGNITDEFIYDADVWAVREISP
ncbi:MAG: hypothetical protein J1F11_09280 [Oscillospiraceae bacterium]|nr:hypothetical protein [Oscillospiraceae bacterium]